jgi:outer membrane protein assembly factor BamD
VIRVRCKTNVFARACLLAGALAVAAGCATSDDGKPVTYSLTAKQNYDKGLAELKDENYQEATRYFSFVKQKFPFSKFAVLAELALADTQFERGSHQEAIDSYKTFIRLHPTHEKVEDGYVAFRICEAYVREMPTDFFLLPPSHEKDQSSVRDALRELDDFREKYPDSKLVTKGKEYRRDVLRRLIDHEMYVANFYADRESPDAAILRLQSTLKRYPDSGREAEILLTLAQLQLKAGKAAQAKDTLERLVKDHARAQQAKRAGELLNEIRRRHGDKPQDKDDKPSHG